MRWSADLGDDDVSIDRETAACRVCPPGRRDIFARRHFADRARADRCRRARRRIDGELAQRGHNPDVFRWSQVDSKEKLEPTEEVVASPPAVTLAANGSYVARIVRV